jgi:hypothetical protein
VRIMRHQHQRRAFALVQRQQQFQHVRCRCAVQMPVGSSASRMGGRAMKARARPRAAVRRRKAEPGTVAAIAQADAREQLPARGPAVTGRRTEREGTFSSAVSLESVDRIEYVSRFWSVRARSSSSGP